MVVATRNAILKALLQLGLNDRSPEAHPVSEWSGQKTKLGPTEAYLTKADAQPLVDEGLLHYVDSGTLHWHLTAEGVREAAKLVPVPSLDIEALLTHAFSLAYFTQLDDSGEPPIPWQWDKGDKASKLVLVLGENAGGKSFLRRIVRAIVDRGGKDDSGRTRKPGPFPVREVIHLSMEARTQGGFMRSAVYGIEEWLSTGANSAQTISKGIETIQGRAWRLVSYWDEPDIGMSNGCAAGAGVTLRGLVESDTPMLQAIFLTSHSEALVRSLTTGLTAKPHYVYLGNSNGPATLADWFVAQQNPKPVFPEELEAIGSRRFKRIQAILNEKRRSN